MLCAIGTLGGGIFTLKPQSREEREREREGYVQLLAPPPRPHTSPPPLPCDGEQIDLDRRPCGHAMPCHAMPFPDETDSDREGKRFGSSAARNRGAPSFPDLVGHFAWLCYAWVVVIVSVVALTCDISQKIFHHHHRPTRKLLIGLKSLVV